MLPAVAVAVWQYQRPLHSLVAHEIWAVICLAVSISGLVVRVLTVGFVPARTSGRNVREQRADSLNTSGIYSLVRHPLYVGNFLIGLGLAMFFFNGWLVAVYIAAFWLYYERIMFAEEEFLRRSFGGAFEEWSARTPAFVPRLSGWRPPEREFSTKATLKREASTLLAIAIPFVVFEEIERSVVAGRFVLSAGWLAFGAVVLLIYSILRLLKTRSDVLVPTAR
jgi:protein-S-isoprenylcysteine O-methyltransferase Ste14